MCEKIKWKLVCIKNYWSGKHLIEPYSRKPKRDWSIWGKRTPLGIKTSNHLIKRSPTAKSFMCPHPFNEQNSQQAQQAIGVMNRRQTMCCRVGVCPATSWFSSNRQQWGVFLRDLIHWSTNYSDRLINRKDVVRVSINLKRVIVSLHVLYNPNFYFPEHSAIL